MAEMPEIGTLSNKTISKLAGLAPLANDSGKHQGKRSVRRGRAAVRGILFLAGSVVARHEPDFIAFQQHLRAAGKPPKGVRITVADQSPPGPPAKASRLRAHPTGSSHGLTNTNLTAAVAVVVGKRKRHSRFPLFHQPAP
jgi:transposase